MDLRCGLDQHCALDQHCGYDQINFSDYNFSNFTKIWVHKPYLEILWKSIIVAIIVLVGLVSNFAVIFFLLKRSKFRRQSLNIFIVNLSIANFLTLLFTPITSLLSDIYQNYELGPVMCKLEILIKLVCILASNFSVIAISCDRFINISCFTSPGLKSNVTTLLVITFIWLSSIVLALPVANLRVLEERQWKDYLEKWCTDCPYQQSNEYWVFLMSPLIYIPLLLMIIVYLCMIHRINKFVKELMMQRSNDHIENGENNQNFQWEFISQDYDSFERGYSNHIINENAIAYMNNNDNNNNNNRAYIINYKLIANKHKVALLKTLFAYCLVTLLFWLPLQILVYYRAFRAKTCWIPPWYDTIKFIAQMLSSTNSAINPFVMFGKTFLNYFCSYRDHKRNRNLQNQMKIGHICYKIEPEVKNLSETNESNIIDGIIEVHSSNNERKNNDEHQKQLFLDKEQIIEVLQNFKDGQYDQPVLVASPATENHINTETPCISSTDNRTTMHHITQHVLQKYSPQIFEEN